jgi:diguanylate cyclase (GGDEF)-like protein
MTLHIPTLMAALLAGFLLLTLELGVTMRRMPDHPELRTWTAGCWALMGGFAFLAARPVVPLWLSVVAGNWLVCLGLVLFSRAIHQLLSPRPMPRWITLLLAAVLPVIAAMMWTPLHARTVAVSLIYVLFLLPGIAVILREGWHAERALRAVAITMLLAVVALAVRAIHCLMRPTDYTDLMQASLGQGLTFLVAFMCLLGAGFGFVLALFERLANQLEKLATTDGLTGCANRTSTDAMLAQELAHGRRLNTPVAFVLMDLDHFKQVNDQHGHRTGDAVLKLFTTTVKQGLRESDLLGRTGGEEFGIILPGTDELGAHRLVDKIRRAVARMQAVDSKGAPLRITVSAGVAVALPHEPLPPERLYGRADRALYVAKRAGRNRVELYKPDGTSTMVPLG